MDYSTYNVEDFILDENFQQWIKQPDAKSNAFWEVWLLQHPEKIDLIQEAKEILYSELSQLMAVPSERLSERDVNLLWNRIHKIAFLPNCEAPPQMTDEIAIELERYTIIPPRRSWFAIAASIILVTVSLSGALYWLLNDFRFDVITTNYGETKNLILPDGSHVILNSNSSIRYAKNWKAMSERCVWLEGEAFFNVVKRNNSTQPKFVVHTVDLELEVLGTQFNVQKRDAHTNVTLQEGKIKLDLNNSTLRENITMAPGDQVSFSTITKKVIRKNVKTQTFTSWTKQIWTLDNTTLADVAKRIETIYGKEVIVVDAELYSETISGALPAKDFNKLLEVISTLYDVQIKIDDNTIIIYK
jgi:transmembrane sensor